MQKKIEELAEGNCSRQSSILEFTPGKLAFEVVEGAAYIGEFAIKNTNNIPIEGTIYSSSPRMECQTPQFQGTTITQTFKFHSEGLCEGDSQVGNLHIVSSQGEYILPFEVSISRKYPDSSRGKIRSITEFANLARESYEEAVKIFAKPEFAGIFGLREAEERLIYQGLCKKPCTKAQVEEFLIAARKKKRVFFQVEEAQREFRNVKECEKHQVTLKKDEWGHLALEIIAQGEWLQPVRQRITEEDFVGNYAAAEYIILPEKLHGGNNFGKLILQTPFQREEVELCVVGARTGREQMVRTMQRRQAELARDYLNFGFRKMVTGVWVKRMCRNLEDLMGLEPENLWYLLMKAQALLVNRQRQEAQWLMDSFPRNKVDKDSPLYAYYLYLCTLREPEPAYVNKCTNQIKKIYHKNQENAVLLWILLFLDEDLNYSKGRKLEVIARHLRRFGDNILLYMEAWRALEKEPFHLGMFQGFDRKILNFAVKHQALTKGMAEQVVRLVPELPVYDPIWYRILEACYQAAPGKETLQAVCCYCIKGNCFGSEYWKWYQMGVSEDLRIAGLYESWVLSAGQEQMKKLPKAIVLYFQSYSNLASDPQAMLYAAIINSKSQWKGIWPHYQKNIREFAFRQLKHGKIDKNLAVIYQEVLTPELLAGDQGEDFAKVLFACEVVCGSPEACNLVVCQHPLKREQVVPFVHGRGYVNIYSSSWQVLLEDATGRRFLPGEEVQVKPFLDNEKFLEQGIACAGEKLPYLVKYFDKKKIWQTYEKEDLAWLQTLVDSRAISEAYREELRPQMVAYFYDNYTGDSLDEFLLNISFQGIDKQTRGKLMNLLVARKHYRRAYELLESYGCEDLSPVKLVYVICHRLEEQDKDTGDEFLLGLCRNVLLKGKYNEQILIYMCRNFYGSLEEMLILWKAAHNFELDTFELEEHCLERFLYTRDFLPDLETVFEHYARSQGREKLVVAYLTWMAHQYLVHDAVVSEYVFHKLADLLEDGQELNMPCKLAFLKWCALKENLVKEELALAEDILNESLKKKKYFDFYQMLPEPLKQKYMIQDKIILEYRTSAQEVTIFYIPCGHTEYVECQMARMYDEIYAREFQMFFGEVIPYYIKEKQEEEWKVTESGQLVRQQLSDGGEDGRYELINDMMAGWQMKDEATVLKLLESYKQLEELVNREFMVI